MLVAKLLLRHPVQRLVGTHVDSSYRDRQAAQRHHSVAIGHELLLLAGQIVAPVHVGKPEFYHVSSGARNPLTFEGIYGQIREYFSAHPLEGGPRGAARLPQWQFPGAASVEWLLATSERAHTVANRLLDAAPRSARTRKFANDLDRTRGRLSFLRRYLSLYNEYAQSELHFVDDHTLALTESLHPDDQPIFAFDTAVYDWKTYIQDVHCPSITSSIRRMDALRRRRGNRPSTMRDLSRDTSGASAMAVFDLDGTIMSTNVIEQYLWSRLPELSGPRQLAELGQVLQKLPPTCGPSGGTEPLSCEPSTGVTPGPTWPPSSASWTPSWRRPSSAGCRPTPVAGSASTGPPVTGRC